jgi:hypothetical protein
LKLPPASTTSLLNDIRKKPLPYRQQIPSPEDKADQLKMTNWFQIHRRSAPTNVNLKTISPYSSRIVKLYNPSGKQISRLRYSKLCSVYPRCLSNNLPV